jgi:hypothetical protein
MKKGSFIKTRPSREKRHASHHPVDFCLLYRAVGFLDDWQLIQQHCSLRFPFFKTRKTMVPTYDPR